MRSTKLTRTVAVVACTGALLSAGATVAYAGEITGTGRSLEVVPVPNSDPVVHGNSICAYSGLNDDYINGDKTAPHVQTPKGAKQFVGIACNPTRGGGE